MNDSARRSNVIKCDSGAAKRTFYVGDASGTGHNPNDTPWNAAKRTLSFWVRSGELTQVTVYLTSSAGERQLRYQPGQSGTNSVDGSGHVTFFLPSDDTDDWMRFERNIEADYEAHSGGATWTNTDGLYITWPQEDPLSDSFYIDEIRLSDSLTVEFNTLGPGLFGHIMRNTAWDAATHARTDRWFHYDQVGTVIATTDDGGSAADTNWFDAFGNRQEDWESGLVAAGGTKFNTVSSEGITRLTRFGQRWFSHDLGGFMSPAPANPWVENRYSGFHSRPTSLIDLRGKTPHCGVMAAAGGVGGAIMGAIGGGIECGLKGAIGGAVAGGVSGAVGGATLCIGWNPAVAGAASGATMSAINEGLDAAGMGCDDEFDGHQVCVGAALGAVTGQIGSKLPSNPLKSSSGSTETLEEAVGGGVVQAATDSLCLAGDQLDELAK